METDSLFVCTEGKKLWIKDLHLILLRKRFKKLDKYSYAIDFCKEMMLVMTRTEQKALPLNEIKDKDVLQK